MRILFVEDNATLCRAMKKMLNGCGVVADFAHSIEDAKMFLQTAKDFEYAAIVLDLKLPDGSGDTILQYVRTLTAKTKKYIPVLVISGFADIETRIRLLERGADDVLVKPFDGRELIAHLNALVRRNDLLALDRYVIGPLSCTPDFGRFWYEDKELALTRRERAIMKVLMQRADRLTSKQTLIANIYDDNEIPEEKIVDVFVCKIRKKIKDLGGDGRIIKTAWGAGYMISTKDLEKEHDINKKCNERNNASLCEAA